MSRGTWNKIKEGKLFNVIIYRVTLTALIISSSITIVLCLAIIYMYTHKPIEDYYATSGIVPPVPLTVRADPNYSTQALLPPDPIDSDDTKIIPD